MLRPVIWTLSTALIIVMALIAAVEATKHMSTKSLHQRSELSAETWLNYYSNKIGGFSQIIDKRNANAAELSLLREAQGFADVFRFKLFDSKGRLLLVSDNLADGSNVLIPVVESNETALQVIAQQSPITEIEDGTQKENRPDFYAETYIPLIENGKVFGVAELYVDVTSQYWVISQDFQQYGLIMGALLLSALAVPMAVVLLFGFQLKKANSLLLQATDVAKTAEKAKARFLANMSHEIRTPMNGIIGMSELISETELNDEQKKFNDTILNSSMALLNIINDVLDFSKIDADKMEIIKADYDLHNCVQDVAGLLFPNAIEKGLEICVDFEPETPFGVFGDEPRLRQCLLNLAGNAVKFTEEGFVAIRTRTIGDEIQISVEDTGRGIPKEKLDSIFNSFQQIEDSDTRSTDGTGLGLPISRRLCQLMGGDLKVWSAVGQGSVFTITLPYEPAKAEVAKPNSPDTDLSGKYCLVVDDLQTNRDILLQQLTRRGIKVDCAASANEALMLIDKMKDAEKTYDFVVSDYHMPQNSGLNLAKRIREEYKAKDLPIIVLSSGDIAQLKMRKEIKFVQAIVNKPIRGDALVDAIQSMFSPEKSKSAKKPRKAKEKNDALAHLNVLLAEDNKTNQLLIKKILSPLVADLQIAETGVEAVDSFKNRKPDIVLMDMSMPEMGGLEASKIIRNYEMATNLQETPIIALTANAMEEDRKKCLEAGMNEFLSKPVRKAQLLEIIADLTFLNASPSAKSSDVEHAKSA